MPQPFRYDLMALPRQRFSTIKLGNFVHINSYDSARPLNLAAMFFCAPAQKHKIGNTSSQLWVLRSNELTQQKETFYIYELNSHQRHFNLNMDEFQSSHAN